MALDVYKDWLGIPEEFRPPTHYQLLRLVDFEDDPEKIRAHYKKLNAHVRKYATGQYSNQSQELLNELAKAMLCLTDGERKRDYDESQGREFEDDADPLGRKPTGRTLVEWKKISREQFREAEMFADERGLIMRDAVVQMKLVPQDVATQAYSQELGLSYIDVDDTEPDEELLDKVPRVTARRNSIIPLFVDDDMVLIACADEPNAELEDELRLRLERSPRFVLATLKSIKEAFAKHYAQGARAEDDKTRKKARPKTPPPQRRPAKKKPRAKASSSSTGMGQNKMLAVLIVCWSVILCVLIDQFVLKVGSDPDQAKWNPFFLTWFIPPVVSAIAFWRFWK